MVGVVGVGTGTVGGVLEDRAQGVDALDEGISGDASVFGVFLGVCLEVFGLAVSDEVVFDIQNFIRADAGEIVGFGKGDEGVCVLKKGGAVGTEALAEEMGSGSKLVVGLPSVSRSFSFVWRQLGLL